MSSETGWLREYRLYIAIVGAGVLLSAGAWLIMPATGDQQLPEKAVALLPAAVEEEGPGSEDQAPALPGRGAGLAEETGTVLEEEEEISRIGVAVMGEVKAPGFYEMEGGSRVDDLLKRARGITPAGDLEDINIAALLVDETTLVIPARPEEVREGGALIVRKSRSAAELNPPYYTRSGWRSTAVVPGVAAPAILSASVSDVPAASVPGLIDINTATQEELESLPGIGPVTAKKIMQYRAMQPFSCIEDLDNVSGIGPKKLEAVRPLVCVQ